MNKRFFILLAGAVFLYTASAQARMTPPNGHRLTNERNRPVNYIFSKCEG